MQRLYLILVLSCAAFARAESDPTLVEARFGHAVASVGNALYVFGGNGTRGILDSVEAVDLERGESREIARLSMPRSWLQAASDGTHIYVVGGSTGMIDRAKLSLVERWTPSSGEWKTLAPLPEPRANPGVVFHEGRLYAIGGVGPNDKRASTVFIYDSAADTWSRGADMPTARETAIAIYKGRIYAVGGYNGKKAVEAFEVYDPIADAWMKLPDLPFELSAHRVAVVNDALYSFGHYPALGRVAAYDFTTAEWAIIDLPYHPVRHTAVAFDGRAVYVTGGNYPTTDRIQRFTPEQLAGAPRKELAAALEEEKAAAQRGTTSAPPPAPLAPEMEAFIAQWADRLAAHRTLGIEVEQYHEWNEQMDAPSHSTSIQYDRDGPRLRVDAPSGLLVLDRTNATLALERRRRYVQMDRQTLLDLNRELNHVARSMLTPELYALISAEPIQALKAQARQFRWRLPEQDNGDAKGDWLLTGEIISGNSTNIVRTSIDPETGLIREHTIHMTFVSNAGETNEKITRMRLRTERTATQRDEPIPAETFLFAPPENWKRVESLRELWQQPGSDGRFELSGKPAPDFSVKLLDGETFTLSAHTGKVVILDFWATWCGPCVKALPEVQKFWDDVRTQDVVVVGISTDDPENEDAVQKMAAREKLTYPVGIDRDRINKAYAVRGIPCIVLIDRNGIVQGRHVGFSSDLKRTLREQTEKMLAGESLPSAAPPDEIEEESEAPAQITRMNPRFFEPIWETNQARRTQQIRSMNEILEVRVRPALIAIEREDAILALDPRTGTVMASFKKPAPPQSDTKHEVIHWAALRRAGGDPVLVRGLNLIERREVGGRVINQHLGAEIAMYDTEGNMQFQTKQRSSITAINSIPFGEREDLLAVTDYTTLVLYNADGERRAMQRIEFGDRVIVTDIDDDGAVDFLLIGSRVGAYRLR